MSSDPEKRFFIEPSTDPSIDNSELVECVNMIKHKFMQATPQKMAVLDRMMNGFDMKSADWVKVWFDPNGCMNVTPGRRLLDIAVPEAILYPSKKGPEDKDLAS